MGGEERTVPDAAHLAALEESRAVAAALAVG